MNLKDFGQIIKKALEYAGDTAEHCKVTVLVGKGKSKEYDIQSVGQFGVVADVTIQVGKKVAEYPE